ncbi:hypothetical protein SKAU_G00124250 [Synaphobranchus kaupii]|uniref:Uncharacterized protein n=1 Tax=Synaphobranchus kaupii TaxID=118154 RepID=A0A9Q1FPD4_SYNKA|nr:hypothetical protein SKAU_G00124250 [Synaphobranchus kaupii]
MGVVPVRVKITANAATAADKALLLPVARCTLPLLAGYYYQCYITYCPPSHLHTRQQRMKPQDISPPQRSRRVLRTAPVHVRNGLTPRKLREAHAGFAAAFPGKDVTFPKFADMSPRECALPEASARLAMAMRANIG